MISSTARVAVVRPALRVASRRMPRHRFSTSARALAESAPAPSAGSPSSHFASGLAGGALVLVGGYTIYHFSELKTMATTAKQVQTSALQAKDRVVKSMSDTSPSEALKSLRNLAKSYGAFIPGFGSHIDSTFDELDDIVEKHGDSANEILKKTYDEVKDVVKKGGFDVETASKLAEILGKHTTELKELGKKAGWDALEKHPEVKDKVGGAYDQLSKLAEGKGPEAKKMLEDVQKEMKDIFKNGPNADSLDRARKLLQSKTQELQNTLAPAARDAWNASLEKAKPYLDKLPPDVRETLTSNAGALASGSQDLFDRVRKAAEARGGEREKLVKDLQTYVKDKSESASQSMPFSWEDVLGYIKKVPGGEQMLEKVPNAQALAELSEKHGEEASKLAKETWDEVSQVLKSKGERAKEIVQRAKDDTKREASK
ncbi:hypothetical protein EXIGLDRAFT_829250 [Exidia glandulosa HHB12029]|uniref:Uncharacterized protein n=1 Tax=Exidia glandulosa HHB12029 TaxID=1314781 RepID=A0A165PLR4_EXIGL|nr:hypothetical protein EXIGLDRAFT_829250 [Exidia glandulosa HHB12029]